MKKAHLHAWGAWSVLSITLAAGAAVAGETGPCAEGRIDGLDARGADLGGTDLAGLDLRGARFDGAVLNGTRLDGANLEGACFAGAQLRGTSFDGANLIGAEFEGALLWKATFRRADIRKAGLDRFPKGLRVEESDFTGAVVDDQTRLATRIQETKHDALVVSPRPCVDPRLPSRRSVELWSRRVVRPKS